MNNNDLENEIKSSDFLLRFWEKVEKSIGCWNWKAGKDKDGYGIVHVSGCKNIKAHRASWIIHRQEIKNGLHVLHSCDNPSCVNPAHLWLGTNLQNHQDKAVKGRAKFGDRINSVGELSHFSKLKKFQVLEIRAIYASGTVSYKSLSKIFGVSFQQIGSIITRKTWKEV